MDLRTETLATRASRALAAFPDGAGKVLLCTVIGLATLAVVTVVDDFSQFVLLGPLLVAVVFVILRPHWGVFAMSAFLMLGIDLVKVGPLRTAELIGMLLAIPFVIEVARERRIAFLGIPHVWILLGIALALVAATVWSELMHPPPPHEAFENTTREFRSFGRNALTLLFFATFVKTPRHVRLAAAVFLGVILVFAWDALDLFGAGPGAARAEARGIADPNRLGSLVVWGTAIVWSFRYHSRARLWRLLALAPLAVLPFVGLLTASRSAFVQLCVLGALILLEQRHWPPAQRLRSLALAGVAVLVLVIAAPNTALLRMTSFEADMQQPGGDSTRRRIQTATIGVMMAAQHPLFGVGPGNFRWRVGRNVGPHNSYLWAVTAGGVGLLALYVLLLHRTYRGFRDAEHAGPSDLVWLAKALRLCAITFVLFSAVADVWLQPPLYWLVGMSIALARHVPRQPATAVRVARLGAPMARVA